MANSDVQILKHIITYCEDISEFIDRFGDDYAVFSKDKAYRHAVCMCIMQIGELANKLSEEFRAETGSQMPWGMIRGMRNMLAHGYGKTDETVLWETAVQDVPGVKEFCERHVEILINRSSHIKAVNNIIQEAEKCSLNTKIKDKGNNKPLERDR